jgi:hypothetical protein
MGVPGVDLAAGEAPGWVVSVLCSPDILRQRVTETGLE